MAELTRQSYDINKGKGEGEKGIGYLLGKVDGNLKTQRLVGVEVCEAKNIEYNLLHSHNKIIIGISLIKLFGT